MTKQRKNEKNRAAAAVITAMHLKGEKGPARTQPQHGKRHGYRTNPDTLKRVAEMLKATKAELTGGQAILAKAGSASREQPSA